MTIRNVKHFLVGVHMFRFNRNVYKGMDRWHGHQLQLENAHFCQIICKSLNKYFVCLRTLYKFACQNIQYGHT